MKRFVSVVLVLAFLFCFTGCTITTSSTYVDAEKYTVGDASFEADKVKSLDIDYVGDVKIVLTSDPVVSVKEEAPDSTSDDFRLHTYLDGDKLFVKYCKSGVKVRQSWKEWEESNKKAVTISLPKDLALSVFALDMAAGSAEIDLSDCETVSIDAAAGDVKFFADNVKSFDADMAAGNLTLGFAKAPESLDVDLAAGNVAIGVPADSGITLSVSSTAGKFRTDMEYDRSGEDYVFGDGSAEFNVDLAAGDVTVVGR